MTQRTRTLRDYLASLPESGPSSALSRDLRIAMLGDLSALNTATNEHLANMIAGTLKGRKSGNGKPQDLSTQDVKEMIGLDVIETITLPNLEQGVAEAQQAADDAMAMAMRYAAPFASRGDFLAAQIPTTVMVAAYYCADGYLISFRRDAGGTAAVTADGGKWSPDTIITPDHWGAIGDGSNNDAPAMQACFDWAVARGNSKSIPTVNLLPNRAYYQPPTAAAININGSLRIVGGGEATTQWIRDDFRVDGMSAGRFDFLRAQVSGAMLFISGIGFKGDFGKPYTVNGQDVTVAWRFAGGNQWEGTLESGTSSTITLPDESGVLTDDGAYDGHQFQIDSGAGVGTFNYLANYVGATRTADIVDGSGNPASVIGGQSADNTSYVQIGIRSPGFCLQAQGLSRLEIYGCSFNDIRNQVLAHTDCENVRIHDCFFKRCARDSIAGRRNRNAQYSSCMFVECGDDVVLNAQENTGDGEAINTIVDNMIVIDCVGMRFIGARRLNVNNCLVVRALDHGIRIGHNSREQPVNLNAIQVTNFHVVDCLNRNELIYGLAGSDDAAFSLRSTSSKGASDFRVPGVVESGADAANDPRDGIWTTEAATPPNYYQPTAWTKISGCSARQTMKEGDEVSSFNGVGTFYFQGTLMTNGYIDKPLQAAMVDMAAVVSSGPQHKLAITDNDFSVGSGRQCITFMSRSDEGQQMSIAFNNALTDVVISGNRLTGGSMACVQFNHGAAGQAYNYDVRLENNVIDVDPYFTHPARAYEADAPNGKWTDANLWAVDANGCVGISLVGNTIKNTAKIRRGPAQNSYFGNVIIARPANGAVQGVFNTGNIGCGEILADGIEWRFIDTDCDPRSATYLFHTPSQLSSATMPSAGRWMAGQRVRCTDPTLGITEWIRLTTGNAHVLGTDWREANFIVGFATGATGTCVRYGDGTQECWFDLDDTSAAWDVTQGALFGRAGGGYTWTYPLAFVSAPSVSAGTVRSAVMPSGAWVVSRTAINSAIRPWSAETLASSTAKTITMRAIGRWK